MLGVPIAELPANHAAFDLLLHPDDREAANASLQAHLTGSALLGGIAVVLAVMQSITWHRYRTGPLAEELARH